MDKIREYLRINNITTTDDLAEYLNLSSVKTRAILSEMDDIDALGGNRNIRYQLKR